MSTEANPSRKADIETPSKTEVKQMFYDDKEVKDIKEGWSTRTKVLATIGTLGLGAGLALGANHLSSSENNSEEGESKQNPNVAGPAVVGQGETSAPSIEPSIEPTPGSTEVLDNQPIFTEEELMTRPTSVVESGLFETLSAEQQVEIQQYDAMSVEEFRELPLEEQLKYAQYLYDNNEERTLYRIEQNSGYESYLNRLEKPSADASGQAISDHVGLANSIANGLLLPETGLDKDEARKLMSLYIAPSTDGFNNIDSHLSENPGGLLIEDQIVEASHKSGDDSALTNEINSETGELSQTSYKLESFTDINGNERFTWRITFSVKEGDPSFQNIAE